MPQEIDGKGQSDLKLQPETADLPDRQARKRIDEKQAEKAAVDQQIADGEGTPRQRNRQAELARQIEAVVAAPAGGPAGYEIPRLSSFCGQWMRHGDWYPDRVLRLFRRDFGEPRARQVARVADALKARLALAQPVEA